MAISRRLISVQHTESIDKQVNASTFTSHTTWNILRLITQLLIPQQATKSIFSSGMSVHAGADSFGTVEEEVVTRTQVRS